MFFQRRHIDDQQTPEKMLKITIHQGNANQNHNKIPPHIHQKDYHQKATNNSAGEGVEKRESSRTAVGNVNWYSH